MRIFRPSTRAGWSNAKRSYDANKATATSPASWISSALRPLSRIEYPCRRISTNGVSCGLSSSFLFPFDNSEAARLHLAVHLHTSVGIGEFFNLHNGNVFNLENVLRDPRYDSVSFVLLHDGFPHDREAIWLAARKNVFSIRH